MPLRRPAFVQVGEQALRAPFLEILLGPWRRR